MPVDEAGLMAAMDAGIAEAAGPAPAAPATGGTDDGQDTTVESTAAPVSEGAAAGGEPIAAGDEPQPDGVDAAAADGAAGDRTAADGTEAAGDKKPAETAEPAEGADKKAEGQGEAAAKDPLNDPLPNALKRETKDRINTLIGMVKENTTKLEVVARERDELVGYIRETNASPEQYGQALNYLKLVNSPNRADREQALHFLQGELGALARILGKPVPGVNMLEGHQDLIDEVSTGRLSPERAQEIAAARAAANFERGVGARRQQESEVTQQRIREANEGRRALNDLGAELQQREPAVYAAKRAVLVKSLKPVFSQIPPSQWAETFRRAYDALPVPVAPRVASPTPQPIRAGAPVGGNGHTPLRAQQPAGSAAPAPKSLLDAINAGIADAR